MLRILLILLALIFETSANAQTPDSCLKLLGHIHGDTTWMNPDSIRVDSCEGSATYGHRFAEGRFYFRLAYGSMLALPVYPEDTIIEVTWRSIDTNYRATRQAFSDIENSFGPFTLKKLSPHISDTSSFASKQYNLLCAGRVDINIVEAQLVAVPLIEGATYLNRSGITSGVRNTPAFVRGVRVYPNPSQTSVRISFASEERLPQTVEFLDNEGRLLFRDVATPVGTSDIEMDIRTLPNGTYWLRADEKLARLNIAR